MREFNEIRRAMQGGDIEGEPQQRMEASAKTLIEIIREQMAFHGAPEEHTDQEIASIVIQVFIEEAEDPGAFIEGALTQLGWQIGVRAAANLESYISHASQWLSNGLQAAALEPLVQAPAGRA